MANFINFSAFTKDNGAVKTIGELLFTTQYKTGDLAQTFAVLTGVENGKHLGFIDSIGDVAFAGRGCNPEYQSVNPKGYEKIWELGEYSTPLEICADDWKDTLVRYAMHEGTRLEDLTDTEVMEKVLIPLLSKAHEKALWRMAWFGDKSASHITDGGEITDTINTNLFTMATGLFKHLESIATANPAQKVAISANSQSTYANQLSAIKGAGVATGIVDDVIANADGRIQGNGGVLFMTNWMYRALVHDYRAKYNATIPYESVSEGVGLSEYEGIKIVVLQEWDNAIKTYQNDGTKWNKPFRVVFANPDNLLIGTSDDALNPDVEISFDQKSRTNIYYSASNIGTLVAEDDLVQVAF